MKFGSLFSGIGGIDLGLERAGMKCLWQVEIDPYCQKILAKHWPGVRRYGDVKEITELEYVDLIAGGFPCQPVSVAGARKGTDDERWLWPEFRRIIRMVRPEFVLVENVPGLLSIDNGRLFGGILGDLAQSGYDAEWGCLSAASVGAPHKRDRVFIVAYTERGESRKQAKPERREDISRGSEEMADSNAEGLERRECRGLQECASEQSIRERSTLENTECNRLEEQRNQGISRGAGNPTTDSSWWATECRLGIHPDGLSSGLDGCGGWECGIPRVARGQRNRVDRLKCLGNAVVPQVAEVVGKMLLAIPANNRCTQTFGASVFEHNPRGV